MDRKAYRDKWRGKIDGEVGFADLPTIFSLAIGYRLSVAFRLTLVLGGADDGGVGGIKRKVEKCQLLD